MAKNNPTTRKSENIQIARISAVQAIIVALIAAIATAIPVYFAGKQQGKGTAVIEPAPKPDSQSARLITKPDLIKLLDNAQNRVLAAGYILDPIDPRVLADKIRKNGNFEVKIALVDPNSKVVCQRDIEGGSKTPGYEKLKDKIKQINRYREGLPEERYRVKLSGRYPTMAVYIIDNDVYAHFYPYAASGSDSPILRLEQKDKNAEVLMNHFRSVFEDEDSQSLPTKAEYNEENPCDGKKPGT